MSVRTVDYDISLEKQIELSSLDVVRAPNPLPHPSLYASAHTGTRVHFMTRNVTAVE